MRTRKGYTLIEMSMVIVVLALLATAVTPLLVSIVRSQNYHTFLTQLTTISAQAREQAIALAKPVDLEFDSSSNQLKIHSVDENGSDQYMDSLQLPSGFSAQRFQLAGKESDSGEWKLNFYPDGSSDGGGIQLSQGNETISIYCDKETGRSTLIHDALPDASTLTWTAGDYIHRAS